MSHTYGKSIARVYGTARARQPRDPGSPDAADQGRTGAPGAGIETRPGDGGCGGQ